MNDTEIAARVIRAARKFEDEGGDLTYESWGVFFGTWGAERDEKPSWGAGVFAPCACPLGAFFLVEQPPMAPPHREPDEDEDHTEDASDVALVSTAMSALDRSEAWVNGFVNGVDGAPPRAPGEIEDDPDPDYDRGLACGRGVAVALCLGSVQNDDGSYGP